MRKSLGAILIPFGLAACAPVFNAEGEAFSYQERHPIAVDPQAITLEITPTSDDWSISREDASRVRAFAAAYLTKGHGPVTVSMPSGSENHVAANRITSDVRNLLHDAGVDWAAITGATYRAPGDSRDSVIFLSFTRYVATSSPCGAFNWDMAKSFSNLSPPNFGCATQRNLAAMVADPHDLLGPAPVTPADAQRRGVVLEKYRAGETTSTEADEQASGVVSEVEGGN